MVHQQECSIIPCYWVFMEKIYEILLIVSASIGFYVTFVLLFISKHNRLLNRLLATFLLTMSIFFLLAFCINRKWAPDFIILIRTFVPLYYFLPASCFLYFRTFIQDDIHLRKKDLIHIVPFSLHVLYISPLVYSILTGHVQWTEIINSVDKQTYFYNFGPIADNFHVTFRLSLMIVYVSMIWKLYLSKNYRAFVAKNKDLYPDAIRWIFYYVFAITANAVFSFLKKIQIFFFGAETSIFDGDVISLCLLISFDLFIAYAIFNPVMLFGLPHFKRLLNSPSNEFSTPPDSFEKIRAIHPSSALVETANQALGLAPPPDMKIHPPTVPLALDELSENSIDLVDESQTDVMRLLILRMNEYIDAYQPFRQPEFNIASLSHLLNVPQHHIAFIIKHVLKKSFVDFRNELRVNYVIACLKKGMLDEMTIEGICTEAGFTSRATFYAAFKHYTGTSPMQYLGQQSSVVHAFCGVHSRN